MPRKNLAPVGGRPLLEYTLRAASAAKCIDATYLSSDDDEILAVGGRLGVQLIRRPAQWASDDASAVDVVRHFLDGLPSALRAQDPLVVYLQPTSPLRTSQDIDAAFRLMSDAASTQAMSVVELKKSPYKAFGLDADKRLKSLFDERLSNARRQDLPPCFMPNGAIYIFAVSDFQRRGGFPSNGSVPYVMDEARSVDIDTFDDLRRVEPLLGDFHG